MLRDCKNKKYDVGFILDESGSISSQDWLKTKDFTKALAQVINIGKNTGRASVITFDHGAKLKIRFNDHLNYNSFAQAVDNLNQNSGGTNIIKALNMGLNDMFQTKNGMRASSQKIVVLITDGSDSNSISKYKDIAARYQQEKIKLLVVGVGWVDKTKLNQLVADPNDYFHANNFNGLMNK